MRDAEKRRALGEEGWKEWQRARYADRVKADKRKQWSWLEDHLARPFSLPWLLLD